MTTIKTPRVLSLFTANSATRHPLARNLLYTGLLLATLSVRAESQPSAGAGLLVRGLHISAPSRRDLPAALELIREMLPKTGVNTLILEFDYQFDFQSRAEFANPTALGKAEVQQLAKACRENSIELIPQLNCLGHQSWSARTGRLLEKHPEFDETPGKYPENKGIYCRSYCPLHPEVHAVVFDLMDELIQACEAKSFHIGMDEVFLLADPDCPRCKGKDPADLFAAEVTTLQVHLKKVGCRLWLWGDRFLDGKATKIGKWEASENGTQAAIDKVPKDIVICDWHYEKAHETMAIFAGKGFDTVYCPWRKAPVALGQLSQVRALRAGADKAAASHALGMVQTTWCGFSAIAQAYKAQAAGKETGKNSAAESVQCFLTLFKAIGEK